MSRSHTIPYIIPVKLGLVKSFIVKGEKAVIVDTGYPGQGKKILRCLDRNSIRPQDVSLIVITHGHIDHYGSAEELKAETGAPVAVHGSDAEYLKKGINYVGKPSGLSGRIIKSFFIRTDKSVSKSLNADIVFEDEFDLLEFGIDGSVIHTPGHTEGSVSLMLSGGEAIIGDLLTGGIVFRKKPRYPLFTADLNKLRQSINRIIQLSPKIIYPSHGRPVEAINLRKLL